MTGIRDGGSENSVPCPSLPDFITCPACGLEMDLRLDEEETRCVFCGYRFFRREATVH